jgi:hypothetical protein
LSHTCTGYCGDTDIVGVLLHAYLGVFQKKKNLDTGGAKISKTTSFFCYNETHAGGEKNRNEKEDEELIVKGGLTFTCD